MCKPMVARIPTTLKQISYLWLCTMALMCNQSFAESTPANSFMCLEALGSIADGIADQPENVQITRLLKTVPVRLTGRGQELETQFYIAKPKNLRADTPVVILNPGLSKAHFEEEADEVARRGLLPSLTTTLMWVHLLLVH